jgi:ubiquinone/menaquinone biosynthesis C-methylase UbiE
MDLELLPESALIRTGPVDHADWNYRPLLRYVSRLRYKLLAALLPAKWSERILEIGYGSGILMPELAKRCNELHGIDIHTRSADVQTQLSANGVTAHLVQGTAENLPFADEMFDLVVAVSSLEFVSDFDAALKEILRVLKPSGCLVVIMPVESAIADWGLRILTGNIAKKAYGQRRGQLAQTLADYFQIDAQRATPFLVNLYSGFRLRPDHQQQKSSNRETASNVVT